MDATKIAIIQAILTYGPQAVMTIASLMKQEGGVTAEEINALFISKDPEDYFNEGNSN